MKDLIGVRSLSSALVGNSLKRDALAFRRIAVPGCQVFMSPSDDEPDFASEMRWLLEQDIVFDPLLPSLDPGLDPLKEIIMRHQDNPFMRQLREFRKVKPSEVFKDEITELLVKEDIAVDDEMLDLVDLIMDVHARSEYLLRPISVLLREHKYMDAYPVFAVFPDEFQKPQAEKDEVVQITVNAFPIPDDTVAWEAIIDYRSDPDTQGKFLALKNWMSEVARTKLSPIEVEEKLEWLLFDYQRHLELNRLKTNRATFETVVVAAADCLGLDFGKAARGLFTLRRRKIELIEGELKAPGSQIAYIAGVRSTF